MSLLEAFRNHKVVDDCPIYDLHGHWGSEYGLHLPMDQELPAIEYLKTSGVKKLVFCHHDTLFCPEHGNQPGIDAARRHPEYLRCYCGINPNYPELIKRDLQHFDDNADVYVGFKFLSEYHQIALDDDRYRPALEFADSRGLPILMHTWASTGLCGAEKIAKTAEKYPHLNLLMGHSLHDEWQQAARLAHDYPNIYCELTAVLDERNAVEQLVNGAGSQKVVYGTDFPWFSEYYYIGALLDADITDEDRRNIFYRNAQRLIAF